MSGRGLGGCLTVARRCKGRPTRRRRRRRRYSGMALDLWNELQVSHADEFNMQINGEGATTLPRDDSNLVVVGVKAAFAVGQRPERGETGQCAHRWPRVWRPTDAPGPGRSWTRPCSLGREEAGAHAGVPPRQQSPAIARTRQQLRRHRLWAHRRYGTQAVTRVCGGTRVHASGVLAFTRAQTNAHAPQAWSWPATSWRWRAPRSCYSSLRPSRATRTTWHLPSTAAFSSASRRMPGRSACCSRQTVARSSRSASPHSPPRAESPPRPAGGNGASARSADGGPAV